MSKKHQSKTEEVACRMTHAYQFNPELGPVKVFCHPKWVPNREYECDIGVRRRTPTNDGSKIDRFALEIEGPTHFGFFGRLASDENKYTLLEEQGVFVIRVPTGLEFERRFEQALLDIDSLEGPKHFYPIEATSFTSFLSQPTETA